MELYFHSIFNCKLLIFEGSTKAVKIAFNQLNIRHERRFKEGSNQGTREKP